MGFFDFFKTKNGEVVTKNPNDKNYILSIENFKDGILHGYCTYYDFDQISREGPYEYGKLHGYWKLYYTTWNGLHEQGMYKNDKREGEWILGMKIKGSLFEYKLNYKNGQLDGPWINYFFNESKVVPHDKFGTQISEKGFYKNGKIHGTFTTYWSNGNISSIYNYKDDKNHGEFKEFTSKGEIMKSGSYINGVKSGYYFENDFIKEYHLIYPQDDFDEDYSFFMEGSDLWIEGNHDDRGRRQGIWKRYYENGTLMSFHNWKDDVRVGTCEHFSSDGVLQERKFWENGEIIKRETY